MREEDFSFILLFAHEAHTDPVTHLSAGLANDIYDLDKEDVFEAHMVGWDALRSLTRLQWVSRFIILRGS